MAQIKTTDSVSKEIKYRGILNKLTQQAIGISINVHNKIGPGFVEKIYCGILSYEFKKAKLKFEREAEIKVKYEGQEFGYQRVDFLIEDKIIIEVKSVPEINNIHQAQLLSYLRTSNIRVGLILNFAKSRLEIKRLVNGF